jgi:glutamyl-tRNA synthetase
MSMVVPPPLTDVRVRFAPSPTGYLHIGGARTALFNWLYARHFKGTFVLRIEDTDRSRNTEDATEAIFEGLRWLNLDWDEGVGAGGHLGPYFQSEREEIYRRYCERLLESGHVYEENDVLRFRFAREKVAFTDLICGEVEFDMSDAATNPDMTIRRPDGSWIFHFVNVVDDIEMRISHVIRGEDHLSNTPKHIQLYRALGVAPPHFAHIPLILNKDGSKMGKRDQGASLKTYEELGYSPEAVRNYLCLLGWSPKDNREKMDINEVIRIFDLKNVNRKNAAFDLDKCTWLSGEYLREIADNRFQLYSRRALERAGYDLSGYSEEYVHAAVETCRGKLRIFSELPGYAGFYFRKEVRYDAEAAGKQFTAENRPRLEAVREAFAGLKDFSAGGIEGAMKATAAGLGVKVGVLVHPTRLALTGATAGPSLYHLIEVLGREEALGRIDAALESFPAS